MEKHDIVFALLANAMHKVDGDKSQTWFVANQFIKTFNSGEVAKDYLINTHIASLKNGKVDIGEVSESSAEDKGAFFKMYPIGNESDYAMFITVKGESSKSVIGFTVKEEVI